MADDFGLKIGLEGEKEFKKALSEINQTFKVLGSEMKLVSSEFDKNDKSVQALTARNQVLNKEIEAQKSKIETLKAALENAAASFGENDRRTQSWQIQLNNAEAALNDMERELGANNDALEEANKAYGTAEDSLDGKIDLIVTKSISRFARNTVDTLTNVRTLKEHNVEVYFEKENIYTFDSKGEVLITIMSSLAQEESRSISENVTWDHRKRFSDGKVSLGYSFFLGYEKGPDKDHPLVIVEEQAAIVRRIYTMFIDGKTPFTIAKTLTEEGVPTPGGKSKWGSAVIESILTNEKYKGSALLQKKFTVDFLQHKMKENNGEVPQYYIEHSHECCPYASTMHTPENPENRAFLGDLRMHPPVISIR